MSDQPAPEFMLSLIRLSYRQSMGDFGYQVFISRLWRELDKVGTSGLGKVPEQDRYLYAGQPYNFSASSYEVKASAIEAYSRILRSGFVVEQPSDNFGTAPPSGQWFRWTERGKMWIEEAHAVPEDPSAYMHYLRDLVGNLDPVVEQYVSEALVSFDRGADFAAAVMVGAACEKLLYLLGEAMVSAIASTAERARLEKLFESRRIASLSEFLREKIDATKEVPYSVKEGIGAYWSAMVEAIRQQRNDAVHPMNAKASRDSVRLSLLALPAVIKSAAKLHSWLLENRARI
ncbi:hypothetical protein [Terriglobus sp. ADX1]|uniref:hypothetical protein n=1 Tax=Terriglobus sp. ADX1 TaxID=2794063 RepID=UPI002FE5E583